MTQDMIDQVRLQRLRQMLEAGNAGGNDLTKRNYAIATLCGAPERDGAQTARLLKLAIAVLEARGVN